MQIFFTSDTHWGHDAILTYEPERKKLGATIQEHDVELVRRINSKVKPEDYLIIVGDVGLSSGTYLKECLEKINSKNLILVRGNHDKHSDSFYRKIGFSWVCYETKLKIAGEYVRICHHPYRKPWYKCMFPWQYKEKDRNKRPIDTGNFLLMGHIHSGGHREGSWRVFKRMINVGVDVNKFYPIPLHEVANIITKVKEAENRGWKHAISKVTQKFLHR